MHFRKKKKIFCALCPEFVAELKSSSDDLEEMHKKMQMWLSNGCRLAWLIDPEHQKVFIYRTPFKFEGVEGFG